MFFEELSYIIKKGLFPKKSTLQFFWNRKNTQYFKKTVHFILLTIIYLSFNNQLITFILVIPL